MDFEQTMLSVLLLILDEWVLLSFLSRECHVDNSVTERTDLPRHLILGSPGMDIFTQELPMVN